MSGEVEELGAADLQERGRVLDELEQWLEPVMRVLAVVWAALIVVELVRGLGAMLTAISTIIWIVFIADFLLRLAMAADRKTYLRRNWLVALSLVVPALRFLRVIRLARLARVARLARASSVTSSARLIRVVSSTNRVMNAFRRHLARRHVGFVIVTTAVVALIGAAGMLAFERGSTDPLAPTSYGEAVWWTSMLLTTIGTDFWPSTTAGRILCFLLSLYGLAVFGYITATLATWFLGVDAEAERKSSAVSPRAAGPGDARA